MLPTSGSIMSAWRFGAERAVLLPSAKVLPRRAAHVVATALGLIDVPTGLGRLARQELSRSQGLTGRALWMAAWRRCTLPYLDLLYLVRSAGGGADDPNKSGVHVFVPVSLEDHLKSGRALIVVVGHFPLCTSLAAAARVRRLRATLGPDDTGPAIAIASTRPYRRLSAGARREQMRAKAVQACAKSVLEHSPELVWEDGSRSSKVGFQLVRAAREPGFLCLITLDPPWNAARSTCRPFAGWAAFPMSTNAARLAAMAQAGVVLALPTRRGTSEFDVALSEVFLPERFQGPEELTNFLAQELERHIGLNATEYLLSSGPDRRWEPQSETWQCIDETQTLDMPGSDRRPALPKIRQFGPIDEQSVD